MKRKKKRIRGRKANRIRILDGAVATATLGLPKTNSVIIARSGKYHRWLAHSTIRLFFVAAFFFFSSFGWH